MIKHIGVMLIVATLFAFGSEIGVWLLPPLGNSFVARVEAIVGRPLTPVSVAGVARRTARRCAVGVYHC